MSIQIYILMKKTPVSYKTIPMFTTKTIMHLFQSIYAVSCLKLEIS